MHSSKRYNTEVWEGTGGIFVTVRKCIERRTANSCLDLKNPSQCFWQMGSDSPSVPSSQCKKEKVMSQK